MISKSTVSKATLTSNRPSNNLDSCELTSDVYQRQSANYTQISHCVMEILVQEIKDNETMYTF